jgi:hypothetical protein
VLVVLALLAVIGLYTAATLQGALFGRLLAGTRVLQQRAFMLGEYGLEHGMEDLAASIAPSDYARELQPIAGSADSVTVELRSTGEAGLPAGFSAGRFVARRYEITSTGRAARGARSVQVQGAMRVWPVAPPP